jgi:hypothetical protein
MIRYKVSLNGHRIGVIKADSEEEALKKAIYLYGMAVDVQELPTKN